MLKRRRATQNRDADPPRSGPRGPAGGGRGNSARNEAVQRRMSGHDRAEMNRFHTLSEMSSPAQDSTSTSASSTDMSSHEQAETNRFLSLTGRTSLDDSQSGTDAELWGDAASQTATAELESTSADPITEALSSFVAESSTNWSQT